MFPDFRRHLPLVVLLLLGTAGPLHAQRVTGSFERTLTVSGAVSLDVSTGSGSIDVTPGPAGSVHIVGRISGRDADEVRRVEESPPIEQTGSDIRIGRFDEERPRRRLSISYEIRVPSETRLVSRSGSGDQRIGSLAGPIETSSGSGSIILGDSGAEARVSTGSGSIELGAVSGDVRATSGSGSIRVRSATGEVRMNTGSGDIALEQGADRPVELSSGSGDLTLRGVRGRVIARTASGDLRIEGQVGDAWELETSSGDVDISVPADAAFDIDLRTSSGSLSIDHPVTVQGGIGRRQVQGAVRGGGVPLRVRTSSGDVRIR